MIFYLSCNFWWNIYADFLEASTEKHDNVYSERASRQNKPSLNCQGTCSRQALPSGAGHNTVKPAVLYWNHGNQEPDTSLRRATLERVSRNSFVCAHLWHPFCPNLNVLMFHHGMKVSRISSKHLHLVFILMFYWLCLNVAAKYCQKPHLKTSKEANITIITECYHLKRNTHSALGSPCSRYAGIICHVSF